MIETTIHMYIRMWCKMTLSFRFSLRTYCCSIASQIGRRLLDAEFLSPRVGGGKMRLLGGQICIHVQNMWQTRGVRGHAPLGNFDFLTFY